MASKFVQLVEDKNQQLLESTVTKILNEFDQHQDVDKLVNDLTGEMEEGIIPQPVYDILNRYVLSSPETFFKFLEKLLRLKGMAEEEVDSLIENIRNTLAKKVGDHNRKMSDNQLVNTYQDRMGK